MNTVITRQTPTADANAMIFAAGLGTRLAPITDSTPKALVEVGGQPLLAHALDHLRAEGFRRAVVNVHHFAQRVADYALLYARRHPDISISISDESDLLLDTAGGLLKALPLFDPQQPIAALNADVLSDAPIGLMLRLHRSRRHMATLLTQRRPSSRRLLFDADGRLCGWCNEANGQTRMPRPTPFVHRAAFNGFHIIEPQLLGRMMPVRPLGIIDAYLALAAECHIGECNIDEGYHWFDVGTPQKLEAARLFANRNKQESTK